MNVTRTSPFGPIVSSSQLASGAMPALSELEFGLIIATHAFQRWTVRAMAAAGIPGLSPLDVLVLHSVNHRGRQKRLADICLVINVEDTYLVTYAIRKLEKLKLVSTGKAGKEKTVAITAAGTAACARYRDIREELLVRTVKSLGLSEAGLSELAAQLRTLSGQYDQATRAAASL